MPARDKLPHSNRIWIEDPGNMVNLTTSPRIEIVNFGNK